jgi:lipoate-protein ligase A
MNNQVQKKHNLFVREWDVDIHNEPVDITAQLNQELESLALVTELLTPAKLNIWTAHTALVVGQAETRLPRYSQAQEQLAEQGWEVVHRTSGGTAFPQCSGVLNISAILAIDARGVSIKSSYQDFCKVLIEALDNCGIDACEGQQARAFCDGDYNILVNGKKLIGTAQRLKSGSNNRGMLAHAAVFFDIDKQQVSSLVNRFYKISGSSKRFYSDAIINTTDLVPAIEYKQVATSFANAFQGL